MENNNIEVQMRPFANVKIKIQLLSLSNGVMKMIPLIDESLDS